MSEKKAERECNVGEDSKVWKMTKKKGMNKEEKERIVWFKRQRRERQSGISKKKKKEKNKQVM